MNNLIKYKKLLLVYFLLTVMIIPVYSRAGETSKLSKKDKCPVCGMFVYKYPDWICSLEFKDGETLFFDGAKDLLKYYLNVKKYSPSKSADEIKSMKVIEYYNMKNIDAENAFYVIGSDVLGPMGNELIAFENTEDASAFKKDHKGKRIVTFREIDSKVIDLLDQGF